MTPVGLKPTPRNQNRYLKPDQIPVCCFSHSTMVPQWRCSNFADHIFPSGDTFKLSWCPGNSRQHCKKKNLTFTYAPHVIKTIEEIACTRTPWTSSPCPGGMGLVGLRRGPFVRVLSGRNGSYQCSYHT